VGSGWGWGVGVRFPLVSVCRRCAGVCVGGGVWVGVAVALGSNLMKSMCPFVRFVRCKGLRLLD